MAKPKARKDKGLDDYRLGFDLGGTKMFAAVLDKNGSVLATERCPSQGYEGVEKGLERMLTLSRKVVQTAGIKPSQLSAIGVACPGTVDLEKGILTDAANLGWSEAHIGEAFNGAFKAPVSVLNDVDAGTWGEYRNGAGKEARSVLGVFPGTGLGGGFVYDGKLVRGRRYSCMEIGDLRVTGPSLITAPDDLPTIEQFASRLNLAAATAIAAYRGEAPSVMDSVGTDLRLIKSGTIANAVAAGDPGVVRALDSVLHYLAVAIAGTVELLGPDRIVMGGGLVEKMPDAFTKGLRKKLVSLCSPEPLGDLRIRSAKLGDDAVIFGAADYAARRAVGESC